MTRWLFAIPLALLAAIAILAGLQLANPDKEGFRRISRAAPETVFTLRTGGSIDFRLAAREQPIAINLFASWCGPCEAEHPRLVELSRAHPGQVYGVLYKDTPENGDAFLDRLGNPYAAVALDPDGRGGLDFGLTGVPETFVISPAGQVVLHIAGPLDDISARRVSEALRAPRS